ncbi:hypothetical protein GW17_00007600 [Ensete ventricosum]|uniref:Uncharacterized protein n=1 Tax=Ensete ventricosum TaxID=4639 RepID=A0A427AU36_ENSVE|nr:hypothetical protein B296_00021001 [Ensete ventricosum]RWW27945.1 hypothetical protein GW17_00007600 [Ensete ventricosum]
MASTVGRLLFSAASLLLLLAPLATATDVEYCSELPFDRFASPFPFLLSIDLWPRTTNPLGHLVLGS